MRKLLLSLPLLLAACATPYDPTPDIQDVGSETQVAQDKVACSFYASQYKRPFNTQGVATSGVQGFGSNLGLAAQGFAGPLLGGAGGILTALAQYLGLLDTDTPRAYQQCLRQRFDRDHAALLVEPPL